jgi:signal transduction histidine kinase
MDGVGTLRITTRAEADAVVVEIADSGAGLDPAVAARAFDAFFTTKDVGKGTGLGLDTARRIVVENHEGTIALVREGDETVVRVRLPR